MRAVPLLFLFACAAEELDIPGETLGEFQFTAELQEADGDPDRCVLNRVPATLEFGALLSRDPDSAAFWLLLADAQTQTPREGTIEGRRFSATVPAPGEDPYPQVLDACTGCEITVTETIEGGLFDELPATGCAPESDPGEAPIEPALLEGVCGRVVDRFTFVVAEGATSCVCTPNDDAPMPDTCELVYQLQGVRR